MKIKNENPESLAIKYIKTIKLDGFIVPQADEFQGESISENNMRLKWLTGFTGSAGTAILFKNYIHLFVDGRYTLQASQEVNKNFVKVHHSKDQSYEDWLADNAKSGMAIGYDPKLHSIANIRSLKKKLKDKQAICKIIKKNPIDILWKDQPTPPFTPVNIHEVTFSGISSEEKIESIAKVIQKIPADVFVLNELDSIAWVFNIRGGDTSFTPLMQGYAVITTTAEAKLFANPAKFSKKNKNSLGSNTKLEDIKSFSSHLNALGKKHKTVALDENSATEWCLQHLKKGSAKIVYKKDPTKLLRARKNPTEIKGAYAAHERDAIAIIRLLNWIDDRSSEIFISELDIVNKVEKFRSEIELYKGPSFPTIAGSGSNGAIIHYVPNKKSNKKIERDTLLLIDSGGQYLDGTTDVTRTVPIGKPSLKMINHFTLVLKGHIAIATAQFPIGTCGGQLDSLARQYLWRSNLNYNHGTGHGVGSYLGVHEGPHSLSSGSTVPLEEGMILSNEPGYYLIDQYGIRIENLLIVIKSHPGFYKFSPLTLVPIDKRLIDVNQLDNIEKSWLNDYHKRVYQNAIGKLNKNNLDWLATMCAPLS